MDGVKHIIDLGALGSAIAIISGWVPAVTAVLTLIWIAIRIYNEMATARDNYLRRKDNSIPKPMLPRRRRHAVVEPSDPA